MPWDVTNQMEVDMTDDTQHRRAAHEAADQFPMWSDDDIVSLAEDIAANGMDYPITVDPAGLVIDGRNRLMACEIAGVEPYFETYEGDPWGKVVSRNVERRAESSGQKAMARAVALVRAGKRSGGRWTRGSVDNGNVDVIAGGWLTAMKKAGYVLDVATRATEIKPGQGIDQDSIDLFTDLPRQVAYREITLDRAHKTAQSFDTAAALAETLLYAPHVKWVIYMGELLKDTTDHMDKPPEIDAKLRPGDRKTLKQLAKQAADVAAAIRKYEKGN